MGFDRLWCEDDGERADSPAAMEARSSSFTGELRAPIMLRREVAVIDDTRRIRREARDTLLSSAVGEEDCRFSSVFVREDNDSRLVGRETEVCRLEPADDMDMLRSSTWRTGSAGGGGVKLGGAESSIDSCSTVSGLG